MRVGTLGVVLLLLPGCGPSAPPAAPETGKSKPEKTKTEEVDVWAGLGDYYGPPAPIVLDPPPVPPEIMGPTPLERLPKP